MSINEITNEGFEEKSLDGKDGNFLANAKRPKLGKEETKHLISSLEKIVSRWWGNIFWSHYNYKKDDKELLDIFNKYNLTNNDAVKLFSFLDFGCIDFKANFDEDKIIEVLREIGFELTP